ncbi:MAG: hypothetical protein ABIK68_02305 [bacterium]
MNRQINRKSLRKKSVKFKPNRDYLNKAVADYLANGGTIKKLEFNEKSYEEFMMTPESPTAVDDFLNGIV